VSIDRPRIPRFSPSAQGGSKTFFAPFVAFCKTHPVVPDLKLLVTTFAKEEQATDIARTLVRERLVACGTLLRGARSIYVWNDQLEDADEIVVLFKTTAAAASKAAARLQELHSYECPEILVISPECANAAYAQWVGESVNHG
jgi:periplasmic divalent cation tolerance protein